jgi:hypothetical protein
MVSILNLIKTVISIIIKIIFKIILTILIIAGLLYFAPTIIQWIIGGK